MRPNLGAVIGGMRDADETRSEAFLGDFFCLLTLTITLVSGSGLGSFLIIDLVTRRVKCETTSCDIVNVEQNEQWKFYTKAFHICYSSCEKSRTRFDPDIFDDAITSGPHRSSFRDGSLNPALLDSNRSCETIAVRQKRRS